MIDFAPSYGIWVRMSNGSWVQLHTLSGQSLTSGDIDGNGTDDVIADFGAPYGIWVWMNNSSWSPIHGAASTSITAGQVDGN